MSCNAVRPRSSLAETLWTRNTVLEKIVHHRRRAHAATDLDAQQVARRESEQYVAIGEPTVARAVEIDDMQPGCAKRGIAFEQRIGGGVVAGLRREVATQQTYAATAAQIDRRNQEHCKKFASKSAPAAPDRSG